MNLYLDNVINKPGLVDLIYIKVQKLSNNGFVVSYCHPRCYFQMFNEKGYKIYSQSEIINSTTNSLNCLQFDDKLACIFPNLSIVNIVSVLSKVFLIFI